MRHSLTTRSPLTPRRSRDDGKNRVPSGIRAHKGTVVFIWLWILTTQAQFRKRPVSELTYQGSFDAQVIYQVVSWLLLALLCVFLIKRRRVELSVFRDGPLLWYLGFVSVAVISASYSPAPAISLFRAGQHIVSLVLIASLGRYLHRLPQFVGIYIAINAVLVVLGALGITFGLSWITPPSESSLWTSEPVWRFGSAFGHPTQLGVVAAASAMMVFTDKMAGTIRSRALLGFISVTTVMLAASRTGVVGLAAGSFFVAAARKRLCDYLCFVVAVGCIVFMIEPLRNECASYLSRGQSQEELQSMTGRLPIYQDAWNRIQEHWFLGQGFQANRVLALDDQGGSFGPVHSHNLILEAWSGTGLFGAICALGALVSLCATTWRLWLKTRYYSSLKSEVFIIAAALPSIIGECMSDAGFASAVTPSVLLFIALAVRAQRATDSRHQLSAN